MIPSQLLIFGIIAVPVLSGEQTESFPWTNEKRDVKSVRNVTLEDSMQKINVSVFFENMELKNIHYGFVRSEFLTHLSFEGSQIERISPMAFEFVPRLSYLSLANNLLQNIDLLQFSAIKSLQTLNLNGNCKTEKESVVVVENTTEEPNAETSEELNAEYYEGHSDEPPVWPGYKITEQPRAILIPCEVNISGQFPSLMKLYLENNNLNRVTYIEGVTLPLLTHLYLSGNQQLTLDSEVMSNLDEIAPSLSNLYLKYSNIDELDTSYLPKIMSLHLDGNIISCICNEYCDRRSLKLRGARNLKILSLSGNRISKIEADAFNYTINLVTLDLSYNRISKIREGTFDKLYLLQSLSLEHNNLVGPSDFYSLRGLINLENLSLGYNNFRNVTGAAFENLAALKTFTLDHNGMFDINSGTFSKLVGLETLSLAGNRLSSIPDGCMPTSGSLITLNLDENKFTSTKNISLNNLQNLLFLSLRNNPLTTMTLHWHSNASENLTINLGSPCLDAYILL